MFPPEGLPVYRTREPVDGLETFMLVMVE